MAVVMTASAARRHVRDDDAHARDHGRGHDRIRSCRHVRDDDAHALRGYAPVHVLHDRDRDYIRSRTHRRARCSNNIRNSFFITL